MKYYLIAGEASGDLHASNLMKELKLLDKSAQFRFFGGDLMLSQGGSLVKHYREMAFMGFFSVAANAGKVLKNLSQCKKDISDWNPDILILVDYAGFNLKIAEFVKKNIPSLPVHFYISPKIWAWKEYRIKAFKKYIDHMYVILPFETAFFKKHGFPVDYVGNPCVDSVMEYLSKPFDEIEFRKKHNLDDRPVLAILAGSRKKEVMSNLPLMLEVASMFCEYQIVIAGAPGLDKEFYNKYLNNNVGIIFGETYSVLRIANSAIVTSGTATLETCLFNVPQVVCYAMGGGPVPNYLFKLIMKVKYFSLVNLIADKYVVDELLGENFTNERLYKSLNNIINDSEKRNSVFKEYSNIQKVLGESGAAKRTAELIYSSI